MSLVDISNHTKKYFTQQCSATSRSGERCKLRVQAGHRVCPIHGGAAPTSLLGARKRLLHLLDPAINTLEEALNWQVIDHRDLAIKLHAAKLVIDVCFPNKLPEEPPPGTLVDYSALSNEELSQRAIELAKLTTHIRGLVAAEVAPEAEAALQSGVRKGEIIVLDETSAEKQQYSAPSESTPTVIDTPSTDEGEKEP